MDWHIAMAVLFLALSGLIQLIAPCKVIDFYVWSLRNWSLTTPTKDWYRSNTPTTIRIVGAFCLIVALMLVTVIVFFPQK